jgi:hypothetical protein
MLIQSLLGMKSRHAMVRDTYRKCMKSSRDFSKLMEKRALIVSPDQRPVLLNCFRLQDLLMEQRAIRFEFLLKSRSLDCALFKSLDEISQRLDKDWCAAEEGALKESNSHYGDLLEKSTTSNPNGFPIPSLHLSRQSSKIPNIAPPGKRSPPGFKNFKAA